MVREEEYYLARTENVHLCVKTVPGCAAGEIAGVHGVLPYGARWVRNA